jgi:zinc-ribbon family
MGSRGREVDVGSGQFYCPSCGIERPYKHKRIGRYFTLYFIPVFQIEKLGEYVECQACHKVYPVEVLKRKAPANPLRILTDVEKDLQSGMAVQKVQAKLMNTGLRPDMAQKIIDTVVGERRRRCSNCGAEYLDTVQFCGACGHALAERMLPARLSE